ncbi:transposase [Streptomyces sp. NPDC001401]|uniref:transposase n=1 Tax=Streptomyces sp. NPDC001401 TaxID=3364570 RepID=UPI00368C6021
MPPAGRTWSPDAEPVPAASTSTSPTCNGASTRPTARSPSRNCAKNSPAVATGLPYTSLRDWARSRLQWPDTPAPAATAPSVRAIVGWITRHPDTLTEDETTQLKAVLSTCPELVQTHNLVRDFAQIRALRTGADLPNWINTARAAQLPGITGCAHGLTTDLEAVTAGLTVRWSSGGTEGAVNRVKRSKAAVRPGRIRTPSQDDPASVTLRDRRPRSVPEPK